MHLIENFEGGLGPSETEMLNKFSSETRRFQNIEAIVQKIRNSPFPKYFQDEPFSPWGKALRLYPHEGPVFLIVLTSL